MQRSGKLHCIRACLDHLPKFTWPKFAVEERPDEVLRGLANAGAGHIGQAAGLSSDEHLGERRLAWEALWQCLK